MVYVFDQITGSIKMITTLTRTATFLNSINYLIQTFSVHEKHNHYDLKTIPEAIVLIEECLTILTGNVDHIKQSHSDLPNKLNEPEGSTSAATMDSIHLLLILYHCIKTLNCFHMTIQTYLVA